MPGLPRFLAAGLRALHGSCRISLVNAEHMNTLRASAKPALCTTWHFAFPTAVYLFRELGAVVMVSRSRDGEFVAQTLKHLGYQVARGSPGKGGAQALRAMLACLERGHYAGLIADGSQGPPCVAQKGILLLARYAEAPLLPVSFAAHPCWRLRSWDRTLVPKPLSHVVAAFGPPIRVPRHASPTALESARMELESALNRLTLEAETHLRADAG
jgi:lysophospholipid acyltransferase (LPLAT)-like uncharacterized protein